MCKLIAGLVGSDEQIVREMVTRLERASSQPGVDIRLTGEIYGSAHMKLRALGLDPHDTTAHELYHGLLNLTELHDQFLMRHLGLDESASSTKILETAAHIVNRLRLHRQAWLLKPSVAKRLLKQTPPKQLQKLLHYRSLDSLLKREPVDVLLTLAAHTEPASWQRQFHQQYKKLTPSDFESRAIETHFLSPKRWGAVAQLVSAKQHVHIVSSLEMGSICILPVAIENRRGLILMSLLLSLHQINEIRLYGTFFKFHQVQPHFGQLLVDTLKGDNKDHIRLAGQPVHWRVVHRYYGAAEKAHPEIFQPHIQPEDLAYRKAEAIIYRLEPALHFWHDLDYVGLPQKDGPISFNLMDNAINLVNNLPYEKRVSYHLRDALWNELYTRYLGQRTLEHQLLLQLDEKVLSEANVFSDMELFL